MCTPKQPKIANIVPNPTQPPEQAPDPVVIPTDKPKRNRGRKNPLRIDLSASSAGTSGVNL